MIVTLPSLLEVSFIAYIADASRFGGLGTIGLITTIVVSVILIATTVWLINGTKRRD